MDPLTIMGIAANVMQLKSFSAEITQRLKWCFDRVDDAPRSAKDLLTILPALEEAIGKAENFARVPDTSDEKLQTILLLVQECNSQVSKLHRIIGKTVPNSRDDKRARLRKAWRGITGDSKLKDIIERLEFYLAATSALKTADVTSLLARLLTDEFNKLPELRQQRTIEMTMALLQQQIRAQIPAVPQISEPKYRDVTSAFDNIPRLMRVTEYVPRDAIHDDIIWGFNVQKDCKFRTVVLSGVLGSGKTQAAIAWASFMAEKEPFHSVFWVDASSEDSIDASFKEISQKLTQPPQNFGSNREHHDYVVKRLESWGDSWLMVVDNCNTPHALNMLRLRSLAPPPDASGYLLATTQLPKKSLEEIFANESVLPIHMVVEMGGLVDDQASQVLRAWENGMQWAGNGDRFGAAYATLDAKFQDQLKQCCFLGVGAHGEVHKVVYRSVVMARKSFRIPADIEDRELKEIKREAKLGLKLEGHHHIIKTVGTYLEGEEWLHMLLYPVAVCDLGQFLADYAELRTLKTVQKMKPAAYERFEALGFDATPLDVTNGLSQRLLEIMGCVTQGMVWMHGKDIRHRDLKPPNVLLRRGEVLLTDFGISEERTNAQKTTTELNVGFTLGYAAPEVRKKEEYNSKEADIYSLGCLFLHILTAIHGPNKQLSEQMEEMITLCGSPPHFRRESQFREHQLKTGSSGHPSIPPHLIDLLLPMFAQDRKQRPTIEAVDKSLRELGGPECSFHGVCCRNEQRALNNSKSENESSALENSKLGSGSNEAELANIEASPSIPNEIVDGVKQVRLSQEADVAGSSNDNSQAAASQQRTSVAL